MTTYNIPLLDIYEYFGSLIMSNITDPLSRTRWVFPDFPEAKSSLPQITIKYDNISYENDSAGDFYAEEYDEESNNYKEYYYRIANTELYFYALSSKQFETQVNINGVNHLFRDKLYNIYLVNQVKNLLLIKREEAKSYNDFRDFNVGDIETPFESNSYTWASYIKCDLTFKDIWVKEYSSGDLIAEYSLTQNILNNEE
jgi:hypothetical protein